MAFTYQYWRILVYNNDGTSAATTIAEWKFYDGGGSAISTGSGTPSASTTAGGTAASNAFDGNASTIWASAQEPTYAGPDWLQYNFGSAVTVGSYSVSCRNDGFFGQSPSAWSLLGSNDGSTWTTIGNYCAVTWVSAAQTQTFNVGAFGLGKAYRLLITANASSQASSIAEWKLYDGSSTQITTSVGASGATSSGGASYAISAQNTSTSAFDADINTFWAAYGFTGPSGGSPHWLAYRFSSSSIALGSFTITSRNDTFYGQTPSAFSLEKSLDGTTWTNIGTFTATWASANQTQTFMVTSDGGTSGLLSNRGMDGGMRPLLKGGMNG